MSRYLALACASGLAAFPAILPAQATSVVNLKASWDAGSGWQSADWSVCHVPQAGDVWSGPCAVGTGAHQIPFPLAFTAEGAIRNGRMHSRMRARIGLGDGDIPTKLEGDITMMMNDHASWSLMPAFTVLAEGNAVARVSATMLQNGSASAGYVTAPPQTSTIVMGGVISRLEDGSSGETITNWARDVASPAGPESGDYNDFVTGSTDVFEDAVDLQWTFQTFFEIVLYDPVDPFLADGPTFETDFSHTVQLWDLRLFNATGDDVTHMYELHFANGTQLGPEIIDDPVTTPEPGTMLLVSTAFGAVGYVRRRRSRRDASRI